MVTNSQEYCILYFKETYVLDICKNRLSEVILTYIQNLCSLKNKNKIIPLLHVTLLRQQIHFDGNVFGNKCCRSDKGSLYHYLLGIGIMEKDGVTSSLYIWVTLTGTNQWRAQYTLYCIYTTISL